ncbi:ATP-dependent DNA helicase DDX31-like [Babylonia areolata]|uniref:ATP-dependent DNA helicase DDX31-like n=1 Tax=Babylonia areolata TaxID=304850 RepID=UPI003FD07D49
MDDGDLSLSLNLNLTSSGSHNAKKKQKVFGNRSQRIKQRKQIKHQKQKAETTENDASSTSKKKRPVSEDDTQKAEDFAPPKKLARKDDQTSGGAPRGSKKTEKGVISSLFRHNPDIPTVKSRSVKTVKEEVFASTKFGDLPLHPHLVANLEEKMQLATMTRVQQLSIPVILREKDVLIKSQTGSGKTLAYAVPMVHTLATLPRRIQRNLGPFAVVIVPTRELAIQSYETFSKLLQSAVWIVAGCLMGGEKRKTEKARIRKGINILVSTPGRLLDHLKHTDCLTLNNVRWLVVDEADRLLELGYEKDIAQIITILNDRSREERQTILLSATLSAGVERLAGMTLRDHESIDASAEPAEGGGEGGGGRPAGVEGSTESAFALPDRLKQFFVVVPCKLRLVTLAAFVLWKCKMQSRRSKVVVFLNTQDSVEFHHQLFSQVLNPPASPHALLDDDGDDEDDDGGGGGGGGGGRPGSKGRGDERDGEDVDMFKLHGDMEQKDRTRVFQEFTEATSGVLFCTDVASRGLHLPKVDWIVQYTTPGATVDYIHRVGRTARAGKQGNALLFLMPSETEYVQELNKLKISVGEMAMKDVLMTLLSAIHDLPLPHSDTKRRMPHTYEEASTYMQDRFEESVLKNRHLQTLAIKGYQSFVRAYATYPSHLKEIFSLKDLHLGHVAKSFALREAPSNLHGVGGRGRGKGQRSKGNPRPKFELKKKGFGKFKKGLPLSATVSEFDSGIVSGKGVSTKPKKKAKKSAFG